MENIRWEIKYSEEVKADLKRLRMYDRQRIVDTTDSVLLHNPFVSSRKKKQLRPADTEYDSAWQLTVGKYRVIYRVEKPGLVVVLILAVRDKGRRTTGEIL